MYCTYNDTARTKMLFSAFNVHQYYTYYLPHSYSIIVWDKLKEVPLPRRAQRVRRFASVSVCIRMCALSQSHFLIDFT